MNDIADNIIKKFASSFELIHEEESCDSFEATYSVSDLVQKLPDTDENILADLNLRDQIAISFFVDDEDSIDYLSIKNDNWNSFCHELKLMESQQAKIKINIEKKLKESWLSIYSIDSFTEYIKKRSLSEFFAIINNRFSNSLIFEVQDDNYSDWSTYTIAFVHRNSNFSLSGIGNIDRSKRITESRNLCYCEIEKYGLIPEDFFFQNISITNELQTAFQKAYMIFACSFIFDCSIIKNDIYEYKLNGFKALWGYIEIKRVSAINVDVKSCNIINEIYQWLYLGGNNNDKINIARNIISLNIESKMLNISNSVFTSILSNYKIYEKENVKQYLEVRNKLSELLIDLQEKIGSIMNSFIGDFKKNIITLVSFFISVIAIKVVSKGDFINGFTNEIIWLSFVFIIISVGLLFYSRWELAKKIELYNKHYNQIKERYKDVLSTIELNKIFEECDPQKDDTNNSFVKRQRKIYSWLWGSSIILLSIFLIVVALVNNNISICQIINTIICYIQNIFQYKT